VKSAEESLSEVPLSKKDKKTPKGENSPWKLHIGTFR
jgi:hypothetical protein